MVSSVNGKLVPFQNQTNDLPMRTDIRHTPTHYARSRTRTLSPRARFDFLIAYPIFTALPVHLQVKVSERFYLSGSEVLGRLDSTVSIKVQKTQAGLGSVEFDSCASFALLLFDTDSSWLEVSSIHPYRHQRKNSLQQPRQFISTQKTAASSRILNRGASLAEALPCSSKLPAIRQLEVGKRRHQFSLM